MLATDVPHVAVQLLFIAAWLKAADSGTIKPLVSLGGTANICVTVPPVELLMVT